MPKNEEKGQVRHLKVGPYCENLHIVYFQMELCNVYDRKTDYDPNFENITDL